MFAHKFREEKQKNAIPDGLYQANRSHQNARSIPSQSSWPLRAKLQRQNRERRLDGVLSPLPYTRKECAHQNAKSISLPSRWPLRAELQRRNNDRTLDKVLFSVPNDRQTTSHQNAETNVLLPRWPLRAPKCACKGYKWTCKGQKCMQGTVVSTCACKGHKWTTISHLISHSLSSRLVSTCQAFPASDFIKTTPSFSPLFLHHYPLSDNPVYHRISCILYFTAL